MRKNWTRVGGLVAVPTTIDFHEDFVSTIGPFVLRMMYPQFWEYDKRNEAWQDDLNCFRNIVSPKQCFPRFEGSKHGPQNHRMFVPRVTNRTSSVMESLFEDVES